MSVPDASSTLALVAGLSAQSGRPTAAAALAAKLGVEQVLLFARDPVLGALIPAPGMPQTIRGGRSWRELIAGCPEQGRCNGAVELPQGTHRSALTLVLNSTAIVLLGGTPIEREVCELERLLPLISALLLAEQDAVLARAKAVAATDAASRSEALAAALEAARADASALNAELREEHRRKDEFLAMLGHELRNPLSPLVTSIELLRLQGADRPAPEGIVDVMARQTAQLSRLVDDLLDVSRVSRGRIELKREHLLITDVIAGALEESRAVLEAHQHEIVVHGRGAQLTVNGDRARLVQVFGNLLNNAAKYTDPGGRIAVTISTENQHAVVRVQDNGIGISPEMQPRIFELFAQAPVALGRAQGGLGIGLTLVRTLVDLHGGRVTVESPGIGLGSTISVALPLAASRSNEAAPSHGVQINTGAAGKSLRVLIVDDNRDAADSLALLLRAMGHHAHVVYDGDTALRSPGTTAADLIFLDIELPGLDGYALARQLRPTAKAGARFVALTGYGTAEGKIRSREAGFDEHVVKPITSETLENLLSAAQSRLVR